MAEASTTTSSCRNGVRMPFSLEVSPQWEQLRASPSFNQLKKKKVVGGS